MKQGYSDICLTMPFKDCNIENTQATMNISFQNVQNLMEIPENKQNIEKKSLDFEIIAFKLVAVNYYYQQENTCHQQSEF